MAMQKKDLDRLRSEAHRLIGAGLFGFQELSYFGGTLESLVIQEQTGGLGLMEALVKKVRDEISRISVGTLDAQVANGVAPSRSESQFTTVLVLDDDAANLKVVCRVLNVKGFIAAPARTPAEALERCSDKNIALFIVALENAETDTYDVIPEVRRIVERNIPVIAMTNLLPSEVRPRLAPYKVEHLLEKPISRDRLLSMIDELIAATMSVPETDTRDAEEVLEPQLEEAAFTS